MQVDRANLLMILESVQSGLTAKDVVEQSSCFVFKEGLVHTFSGQVACSRKSPLKKSFEGAVQALPLLKILNKLSEEQITILTEDEKFILKGKGGKRTTIAMESDLALPIHHVETPEDWKPLHEDFTDAINVASKCVGKSETDWAATCIYLTKSTVEACDGSQCIRYFVKTRLPKGVKHILVRGTDIKHIVSLGMTEFSLTETWIHFKNTSGLILSCRKDDQEFPPIDKLLEVEGENLVLPKRLIKAVGRAEIFSEENSDENEVRIVLRPGKMRVYGEGITGGHREPITVKYKGTPLTFTVGPKLLIDLVERFNECIVCGDRLKVDAGKFHFVVAVGPPKKEENSGEQE